MPVRLRNLGACLSLMRRCAPRAFYLIVAANIFAGLIPSARVHVGARLIACLCCVLVAVLHVQLAHAQVAAPLGEQEQRRRAQEQGLGPTGFSMTGMSRDATGTTYAAVAPGSITVRGDAGTGRDSTTGLSRDTTHANGSVQNTFDAQEVQNDMATQQSLGQVGMRVAGDVATARQSRAGAALERAKLAYADSDAAGDTAGMEQAQADMTAANQQLALWGNDGAARIGSHAVVAGLGAMIGGGNVAGAVGGTIVGDVAGNAASSALGDSVGGKLLSNVAAGVAGAAVGGALGGSAGAISGSGSALTADLYNRQLHPDEKKWIDENEASYAKKYGLTLEQARDELTTQANLQVQNGSPGPWNQRASEFLGHAHGMLPADGNSGPGYMFYATPEQKANTDMYAKYYPGGVGMNTPTGQEIASSASREQAYRDAYTRGTIGAAAGAATIALGGPIATLPGAPIFSSGGALGLHALASPLGIGSISAGINAGAQYAQNGTVDPIDVGGAFITGAAGSYGGLLRNVGVNAIGGATTTALHNILQGKSDNIIGTGMSSGALSGLGYGAGKIVGNGINSTIKPTINRSDGWASPGVWSGNGYNIFRPNASAAIGATFGGSVVQEALQKSIQSDQVKTEGR